MNSKKLGLAAAGSSPVQPSPEEDNLNDEPLGAIALSRDFRSELLNPESWSKILETYAGAMKLAVALTDPEGHLLGPCHNPQPVWRLAREAGAEPGAACQFCLLSDVPCSAVADALNTGRPVIVRGPSGLTHTAVPLSLGGQPLGALLAGQVFSRYPEPLPLQRVAAEYGASAQQLWQAAIRQVPVSSARLQMYGDLLAALGQAFVRQRYAAVLERRVRERTEALAQSNDDLLHANHALEQFAYSASHDLQEPLRNISCYTQLFTSMYSGKLDRQADEYLGYITEGAKRMGLLVQDLLSYTRTAAISDPPHAAASAVLALQSTLLHLKAAIRESRALVQYDDLPSLYVHPVHLEQLFQNLIGNAIKYRKFEHPPIIHISAAPRGDKWLFSVRDNGIGIESHYTTQIFGIFKRLHSADKYPGTGIGLALCQKIIERYRGHIWVESELGKGSTFCFTLPARGNGDA
ncbi:MAG: ATP-binding protein [Bryobacteraceae bacterium]